MPTQQRWPFRPSSVGPASRWTLGATDGFCPGQFRPEVGLLTPSTIVGTALVSERPTIATPPRKPFCHFHGEAGALTAASAGTGWGVFRGLRDAVPLFYSGPPSTTWGMNPVKQAVGEGMMQRALMRGYFEGTKWSSVTPARVGRTGIDGLFFRVDSDGALRNLLVGEAKYGTSRLGHTASGRQMSASWIRPRLAQTASTYERLASRIKAEGLRQSIQPPPRGANVVRVPLSGGRSLPIWESGGRLVFRSSDRAVDPSDIVRQTRRAAQFLAHASDGTATYRSRLVPISKQLTMSIQPLDHAGRPSGRPVSLPGRPDVGKSMLRTLEEAFRENGYKDARRLAEKCLKNPGFFNSMNDRVRMNPGIGLQWQNFASAGAAGMISFLAAMVADLLRGHDIRWSRHAGSLFVTSFGALTGGWVGSQTASALLVTPLGQRLLSMVPVRAIGVAGAAGALGGAVGGVVVTALVSYLMAIFGLSDWKTAHREMVAGSAGSLAGAGAAAGTFFGVAAWGTASTGTAIGSLSGAAATNAALAAIGGGSMAVGSAILTGGAALVMLAVAGGVRLIFSHMDARARHLFLVGRIEIVRDLVGRGKQPEWVMA